MKRWLTEHRDALGLALRRLLVHPFANLLAVFAIGIALALPGAGAVLLQGLQRTLSEIAPKPQISVYLPLTAERSAASALELKLRAHPQVSDVEFIDREATLARFKTGEGLREVLDALPQNPFPHAFVVRPRDDGADAMDALAAELRSMRGLEHVQVDSAWVRRVEAAMRLARGAVAGLALLFAAALIGVTFNATRVQVLTRRDEIEVALLLGATHAFVRRPFIYFATVLGALGALAAAGLIALALARVLPALQELAVLYGLTLRPVTFDWSAMLGLAGIGSGLCAGGTLFALRRAASIDRC